MITPVTFSLKVSWPWDIAGRDLLRRGWCEHLCSCKTAAGLPSRYPQRKEAAPHFYFVTCCECELVVNFDLCLQQTRLSAKRQWTYVSPRCPPPLSSTPLARSSAPRPRLCDPHSSTMDTVGRQPWNACTGRGEAWRGKECRGVAGRGERRATRRNVDRRSGKTEQR